MQTTVVIKVIKNNNLSNCSDRGSSTIKKIKDDKYIDGTVPYVPAGK